MRFPPLFISHGSPQLAIEESPARDFLKGYGAQLGKPKAIVIASAHFNANRPAPTREPHARLAFRQYFEWAACLRPIRPWREKANDPTYSFHANRPSGTDITIVAIGMTE